jgi:5-methylcytosine-specific restriction endonuclease McrA
MSAIPNRNLTPQELDTFLADALSEPASDWVRNVVLAVFVERKRFSQDSRLILEDRQLWRCATCGVALSKESGLHVDHMRPISLGGSNEPENLQILCAKCNMGMSNLISWVLDAPYDDSGNFISAKKRFCVLKRDGSRCRECGEGPPVRQVEVTLAVPQSQGGRYVMANLQTLGTVHAQRRNDALRTRVRTQMMRRRRR